jgi:hypothetical protein
MIGVGAHIGSFSFARVQRGASRIYSYETDLENFFKEARFSQLLEKTADGISVAL